MTADDADQKLILHCHSIIRTADHNQARGGLEAILGPHVLSVENDVQLDIRVHTYQLRAIRLSYVSFGADVHVRLARNRPGYLVQVPLAGHVRVHGGDEHLVVRPGAGAVLPPDEQVSLWCSADCGLIIVTLEGPALRAHTRSLLNLRSADPLRFDLAMDLDSGCARDWYEILRMLAGIADSQAGMLDHPLVIAAVEHALMTGLLVVQPNTYAHLLAQGAGSERHRPTDAAILLINAHPEHNHTVAGLAQAAGVSVRTLEKDFRRKLGATPRAYLRQVRLERAREELMAPAAETKRVSDVAARWGLHHFGRFAQDYYRKYHEKPSETIRRSNERRLGG